MPTIGVAIAVPDPYGSELRAHRASFGDPLAETVPSHVTLLPPTEVEHDEIPDVIDRLESIASQHPPFTMRLHGTGTFRPVSPVVFVTVSEGISPTEMLAAAVRDELLRGKLEFPYHPHITVAHHLDERALDNAFEALRDYECRFDVTSFALYVHDGSAGWTPSRVFDLTGGAVHERRRSTVG
ncbi:MAG TPA: 2'-5' RNA ligase family protein [Nocardioidaceae bacterium]|nr:2'-5' RNA ligase family protein [Nocardioidaceae bacterium]